MRWWSTWPRTARLAAIVLLLAAIIGWGMAIQRASQLHDIGARLSATELEGQSRQQRIQELKSTLTRERQSAGDLASLTQRLDAAGADLAKAKEARAAAESRMDELASTIKSGEQRLAELQPQLTQAQQQLAQSQQQLADRPGSERAGPEDIGSAPGGYIQGRERRCARQGIGGPGNRARRSGGRGRAAGQVADR